MSLTIGILLAFFAAVAWGLANILFKIGVTNTRPLVATYSKGVIAIPLLLIIGYLLFGLDPFIALFQPKTIVFLFLAALSLSLGDFFSLLALNKANVSIVQPITTIYPLFSTFILLVANIEKITWQIILGTILITIGVAIVSYFSSKKPNNHSIEDTHSTPLTATMSPAGIIFALLAAVSWGATIVFTRMLVYSEGTNVIVIMGIRNTIMVIGIFLYTIVHTLIKHHTLTRDLIPSKHSFIYLVLGGLVAWDLGGVAFFTAVGMIGAGISTPISSISPIIVLFLGFFWLKEKINASIILGVIFVVAGSITLSF
ncbi:MAG: DMT family transporter [Candidatus Heimdallarchaeaceae archaeon]